MTDKEKLDRLTKEFKEIKDAMKRNAKKWEVFKENTFRKNKENFVDGLNLSTRK